MLLVGWRPGWPALRPTLVVAECGNYATRISAAVTRYTIIVILFVTSAEYQLPIGSEQDCFDQFTLHVTFKSAFLISG